MIGNMKVMSEGFLATIQDGGRQHCQHLGLAEAGAMDKHALFWGNRLLGNAPDAAAVEILLGNSAFVFDAPTRIAITGASVVATLNDVPVSGWATHLIRPGDVLRCGFARSGLRAYLCVAGGVTVAQFFGSGATVIREKTGGNQGQKLSSGDVLCYLAQDEPTLAETLVNKRVPQRYIPDYDALLTVGFFPGYHYDEFDPESIEQFLAGSYTITQDADRMGYRLAGAALKRKGENILSIGVPCGAIQIPTAGEPIVLLNDRQCTGGYPVLGVVATRDIFRLAQRRPGDKVHFAVADLDQQRRELRDFTEFFTQDV